MIDKITEELGRKYAIKVEGYIQTIIKPKPKWLPIFIWKWFLKNLVTIQETQPKIKGEDENI